MNRILLVLLAVGAGAIGLNVFHRTADETRANGVVRQQEWMASTNRLVHAQEITAALRREVQEKKRRLREAARHPDISPELLLLLEGDASKGHPAAWAELRQQLGIGWNSSPDYVLVSKRVLNKLDFQRLDSATRIADTACALLALSPEEQSALEAVLQHAREGQWLNVARTEPGGDIVAQFTVTPPDLAAQQGASNAFAAAMVGLVGPERAALLLPQAWRELRSNLGPAEAETITIRRSTADGQPDLVYEVSQEDNAGTVVSQKNSPLLGWCLTEMRKGQHTWTSPVRYGQYPSIWFLTMFPGGWDDLARREGFELPPTFRKP